MIKKIKVTTDKCKDKEPIFEMPTRIQDWGEEIPVVDDDAGVQQEKEDIPTEAGDEGVIEEEIQEVND